MEALFLCTNDAISMIQKVTQLCNVNTCKHLIIEIKLLETQDSAEKVKILLRINHLKTNAVKNHMFKWRKNWILSWCKKILTTMYPHEWICSVKSSLHEDEMSLIFPSMSHESEILRSLIFLTFNKPQPGTRPTHRTRSTQRYVWP